MAKSVKPFFYYAARFPKILQKLDLTLVYSTYQAGKLIFISSLNGKKIAKYAKNFKRPMGIAYDPERSKLAIASRTAIDIYASTKALSFTYPESPKKYDKLFVPQSRYYTGYLDTHEIEFGNDKLWIINTMFSCISTMSEEKHFDIFWKPDFITDMQPEDRCHLNGLALENGKPAYVTMFDSTNEKFGWKKTAIETGILMDVRTNKILSDQLPMPHSPALFDNKIYFLLSGIGEIMYYDLKTNETKKLAEIKSFLRGLAVAGDFLFIGASKIREESTSFSDLPISAEESYCGIYVINRHTGENVAGISYTEHIKEIFSIKILPNVKSPALLTERDDYYDRSIMTDKMNFWVKEKSDRQ